MTEYTQQQAAVAPLSPRTGDETWFRTVFERSALGVALTNPSGAILACNPALKSLLGYQQEELTGTPVSTLSHPEDRQIDAAYLQELFAGKRQHFQVDRRYLLRNGQTMWGRLMVSLVTDTDGSPQYAISIIEDITEHKTAESQLQQLLYRDELTGLHNRRGLLTLAEHQLRISRRSQQHLLAVYGDIDGLNWINKAFGRREGDHAVQTVAAILRGGVRDSDIVARMGSDEFLILAIDAPGACAAHIIDRIEEKLAQYNVAHPQYTLQITWGIAEHDPQSPLAFDDLLLRASEALSRRKQAKRTESPAPIPEVICDKSALAPPAP